MFRGFNNIQYWPAIALAAAVSIYCSQAARAGNSTRPIIEVPNADAGTEADMKPYTEVITGADVQFDMVPIPSGEFVMGSPESEEGRGEDEGPQHTVQVSPFWMGKHEVSWDEYEVFMFSRDIELRRFGQAKATELDEFADTIARPTKPYTDMTFGMGRQGFPAICMTQYAAKMYCEWLSAKTGRYYRLPTEAEWEYACRAGTNTAYSFGDDVSKLSEYAWFYDEETGGLDGYAKIGQKKPNPWGLYDIHGNVAEWVLDKYVPEGYPGFEGKTTQNPLILQTEIYPRVVRGGSWDDDPEMLRSASRLGSSNEWKRQDPQLPQSVWYHTDAQTVGFRVIRPLHEPSEEEKKLYAPDTAQIEAAKVRR